MIPVFSAISIQTNNKCNLKCKFCFYGQYKEYGNEDILSTEVIYDIFYQLRDLGYKGRISLYNLNEPLTDPRIFEFLKASKKILPGCFHFFSTNGVRLDQKKLDAILENVDHLRLNCYTKLPDLDLSHPKIDFRDKTNFYIQADSNRGGNLKGIPSALHKAKGICANPFGHLVIIPKGDVVLCCSDGFKKNIVGDVKKQTLIEVWNGKELNKIRELLINGRRDEIPLCRECSVADGGFYEYYLNPARFKKIIKSFHLKRTPSL